MGVQGTPEMTTVLAPWLGEGENPVPDRTRVVEVVGMVEGVVEVRVGIRVREQADDESEQREGREVVE